jgi:hypothetical protein
LCRPAEAITNKKGRPSTAVCNHICGTTIIVSFNALAKESGGKSGAEMIVRVAEKAVNKNKCTLDFFIYFSNGCVRYTRTRDCCPAGFIHSVQSDVVEAHGTGRTTAASKSPKNMGK